MTREFILDLLKEIKAAESGEANAPKLPGNAYYLDYDKVLCASRDYGESRFPYSEDGLVVWLRSTGFIDALESKFTIFRTANFGEESPVDFFGGIPTEDGYFPVSITGAGRQLFEKNISRYIVYSLKCAYCIADAGDVVFALRLHVDKKKHIHFELSAVNKTDETKDVYLAEFMEALLRHSEVETFWQKMTKFGRHYDNGSFTLTSKNGMPDTLVINKKVVEGEVKSSTFTTARSAFIGHRGMALANAMSLKTGKIERQVDSTTTTDLPVAAEIMEATLEGRGILTVAYEIALTNDEAVVEELLKAPIDKDRIDEELCATEAAERLDYDNIKIRFDEWKSDKTTADTFNKFLRSVQKQTSFCAHGKNYAGAYLGIRDVFQQLEGALIWQRDLSKEKILVALNNILDTGRPPRMFSVPSDPTAPVPVSLEKYIDQGVWVISTVYTYLSYTGDYSLLNEECGYITASEDEVWCDAPRTGEKTTVLEHLIRITDFLLSDIDTEYTKCLKVLFGDWNDAVDGLGTTEEEGKEFGTGVTVMATLQFLQNLREMTEILSYVGGYNDKIVEYAEAAEGITEGLEKYAIDEKDGRRRIIHGWGDKVGYKVASFCDPDGIERFSLTPNSFWAITGFVDRDPSLKESIMECMDAVSSKYGLKTFDKPFPKGLKGVGRITNIVPGTYENSCAYAHGSLFGTQAMFKLGEAKRAWDEIEKTIVITHDNATMTSFVMPNSYCENPEYNMDGESLGDWHTGSGCVLMKEVIRYAFGVHPTLDGLEIAVPAYFPSKKASINLRVKDTDVEIRYEDKGLGERKCTIEGASGYLESKDIFSELPIWYFKNEELGDKLTITVCD